MRVYRSTAMETSTALQRWDSKYCTSPTKSRVTPTLLHCHHDHVHLPPSITRSWAMFVFTLLNGMRWKVRHLGGGLPGWRSWIPMDEHSESICTFAHTFCLMHWRRPGRFLLLLEKDHCTEEEHFREDLCVRLHVKHRICHWKTWLLQMIVGLHAWFRGSQPMRS